MFFLTPSYTDTPVQVNILKRNSNLKLFKDNLEVLPKISHIKPAKKKKDLASLLKYFCIPEDAKQFYDDMMQETANNIFLDDENPEGATYYDEYEC